LAKFELFIYRKADRILEEKGLYQEVLSILRRIKRTDHKEIQEAFDSKGWQTEQRMFPEVSWSWDAYKKKVAVSIELSLIDVVHRDFLRAMLAHKHGDLDALVYVTSAFREPKFYNVKRDIEIFSEMLAVPIILVGLT